MKRWLQYFEHNRDHRMEIPWERRLGVDAELRGPFHIDFLQGAFAPLSLLARALLREVWRLFFRGGVPRGNDRSSRGAARCRGVAREVLVGLRPHLRRGGRGNSELWADTAPGAAQLPPRMSTSSRRAQGGTAPAVVVLILASAVCVALLGLRDWFSGHWRYLFLPWNLFLAWLPLVFALLTCRLHEKGLVRSWKFLGAVCAWLIFLPNAPYIFTDLIHLPSTPHGHFWVDLILILLFALTGFLLGFMSLRLMQSLVARMTNRLVGWIFVVVVAGLSGFGVYLGRFQRWNSWDLLLNPVNLVVDIGHRALHPLVNPSVVVFPALFAVFFLVAYLMLTALVDLPSTRIGLPDSNHPVRA
jgi:uncharacterized membrane protein